MFCQTCGVEAPTKYVEFHRNIGLLFLRLSASIKGDLCKRCIHKHFWEMTLVTIFLGWWGVISFLVTPFFLLNNVIRYVGCLKLQAVPPGATVPSLTEDAVSKLERYTERLVSQINAGEPFERVVEDFARRARVTPGQVVLYIYALAEASKETGDT